MKKNAEKVDKGFELFYAKLSWRRKFIRTLWFLPFTVLCLVYIWERAFRFGAEYPLVRNIALISTPLIVGIWIWQAVHTYRKWKAEEQNQN